MSREDLSKFVEAAERSLSLRDELRFCKNDQRIIEIAAKYGFSITLKDINEDKQEEMIEDWFRTSEISPFKKAS